MILKKGLHSFLLQGILSNIKRVYTHATEGLPFHKQTLLYLPMDGNVPQEIHTVHWTFHLQVRQEEALVPHPVGKVSSHDC